jgi:hypothetical protein
MHGSAGSMRAVLHSGYFIFYFFLNLGHSGYFMPAGHL